MSGPDHRTPHPRPVPTPRAERADARAAAGSDTPATRQAPRRVDEHAARTTDDRRPSPRPAPAPAAPKSPAPFVPPTREALERECELQFFIASGPGGQHRNKTESGVRLIHRPTGVVVTATERRSQHQNREVAFERLLERLAARAVVRAPRKKTKVPRAVKRRRLADKRATAQRKADRRKPGRDD